MKHSQRERLILAEVADWPQSQRERFEQLVRAKCSIPMAHLLASRRAPGGRTDSSYMSGQFKVQNLPDWQRIVLGKQAAQNGYSMRPTDTYHPGLARFPGDPEAFLNHGEARGKLKEIAESRGVDIEGAETIKGARQDVAPEPVRKYKLHPRIVERIRKQRIAADPSLAHVDQGELRHQIIQDHAPNPDGD